MFKIKMPLLKQKYIFKKYNAFVQSELSVNIQLTLHNDWQTKNKLVIYGAWCIWKVPSIFSLRKKIKKRSVRLQIQSSAAGLTQAL